MNKISRGFVSNEQRQFKFKLGNTLASALSGFIAGLIAALIVVLVAL